jgi:WD40 repeat protein
VGRVGDRDVIISGSADETVRVWDARTGQVVGPPLTGHTGPVGAVAVGRVGDRDVIISGSGDLTVRIWDARTGQPHILDTLDPVGAVAIDGDRLAFAAGATVASTTLT